ncbi:MAG: hypothetical protein ACI9VR_005141, partial [Cognaticolwellia sp.]
MPAQSRRSPNNSPRHNRRQRHNQRQAQNQGQGQSETAVPEPTSTIEQPDWMSFVNQA